MIAHKQFIGHPARTIKPHAKEHPAHDGRDHRISRVQEITIPPKVKAEFLKFCSTWHLDPSKALASALETQMNGATTDDSVLIALIKEAKA